MPKGRWIGVGVLRTRQDERSYADVYSKQARQVDRPEEKRATKSSRGKAEMKNRIQAAEKKENELELARDGISSKVRMLLLPRTPFCDFGYLWAIHRPREPVKKTPGKATIGSCSRCCTASGYRQTRR